MEIRNWEVLYNPPSKFTLRDRGTVVQVILDTSGDTIKFDLYMQVSPSKETPKWVEMSDFVLKANYHRLHCSKYLDEMLDAYDKNDLDHERNTNSKE